MAFYCYGYYFVCTCQREHRGREVHHGGLVVGLDPSWHRGAPDEERHAHVRLIRCELFVVDAVLAEVEAVVRGVDDVGVVQLI